jgi:hypothetical protein
MTGWWDLFLVMPTPNGSVYMSTKCECSNERAERDLFLAADFRKKMSHRINYTYAFHNIVTHIAIN